MKDAIATEAAFGQSLGIVLESIGRRLGPVVGDREAKVVFDEDEVHLGTGPLDGSGLDIAGNPEALAVGAVAHAVKFFDGDVVAFALLYAGVGQVGEGEQDDNRHRAEFQISAGLTGHGELHPTAILKLYAP